MKFPPGQLGSLLIAACVLAWGAGSVRQKTVGAPEESKADEKAPGAPSPSPLEKDRSEPQAKPEESRLPAGILARVNGIDVSIEDYSRFLLASIGKTKLRDLVDRLLVEQRARELKVEVSPDEVAQRVEDQIDNRVRILFRGDRAKFEEVHLAGLGMNIDEYRDFQAQKLAFELLLERCILERREITEAEIQRQFEKTHGPGGVQLELRHILIGRIGFGSTGKNGLRLSDEEARKKAEAVLKAIREGAEFVDMVREHSEDLLSKRNDGRIPVYRPGLYGEEFDRALASLSESQRLSGVVKSQRGYHIVYFLGKTETKLEDRREEIIAFLRGKTPTAKEKQDLLRELRKAAKIRY